jgi:EmrB/QacA subfamily drug resistance transporter
MGQLIGFRVLQGLGAGGLAVGAMAIIGELVSPRERGKYQGMTASVMAVATIGGPLVGGFITEHLGWRWSFYINLPLGAIALVWCAALLHLPKRRSQARIDYLGAVLLTSTITSLVLIATWGGADYAWASAQIVGLAVLSVVSLVAFIFTERRAAEPILPLHLFRSRNLVLSSLMAFVVGAAMFGATTFLPLFQQTVQGASASNSGLLLLPMMIPIVVVSQIAGRTMSKTGKYKIFPILGTGFIALGMFLLSTMDTGTGRGLAGVYMALVGVGLGFVMQMLMVIAQNSADMKDIGAASAASTLFRTIGSSFGVALFGALFNARIQDAMGSTDTQSLSRIPAALRDTYLNAVVDGTHTLFLWGAVLTVAGFAAAWFIREVPLRGKPGAAPVVKAAEKEPVATAA